jgi:hypothetical protein
VACRGQNPFYQQVRYLNAGFLVRKGIGARARMTGTLINPRGIPKESKALSMEFETGTRDLCGILALT